MWDIKALWFLRPWEVETPDFSRQAGRRAGDNELEDGSLQFYCGLEYG